MIIFEKLQKVKEMVTQLLVYKMIARYLINQQAHDANPRAIQQISFTGNQAQNPIANTTMVFIIEEGKETVLDFL